MAAQIFASLRPLLAAALLGFTGFASAQDVIEPCGPLRPPGQFGPWDFRKDAAMLPVVVEHHFTPQVEMLIRGQEGSLGSDLDYTLRAIPNHPRALIAMMNLGARDKSVQPVGAKYSVECYLERAIRFQTDDQVVRMIYVTYLTKLGRVADAKAQLTVVEGLAGDNPFTHYNLGLLYLDLKDTDKALAQAHTAYSMGIMQTTLKDKLVQLGRWTEPPAEAASASASQPASAPAPDGK